MCRVEAEDGAGAAVDDWFAVLRGEEAGDEVSGLAVGRVKRTTL